MMASGFFRSRRLLERDDFRAWRLSVMVAIGVLCTWVLWLFLARVAVYRVSDAARLESGGAAYQVQAPVAGRVVSSILSLGLQVEKGRVLVQLEDEAEQRQLQEERTALTVIAPQLEAIRDQIKAEEAAQAASEETARVALNQARTQLHGATEALQYAEDKARRYEQGRGAVAEIDLLKAQAEAQERRTAVDNEGLEIARLERDQVTQERDRTAHIDDLQKQARELEGEVDTKAATVRRLEYESERRKIRAPITGSLAEVGTPRVGTIVREGELLASIVPSRTIYAVAEFVPSEALGHIRPGQRAWIRLKGFPWTEYGSLEATVVSVASEIRDGSIRVEFTVAPNPTSAVPIQHGLPGMVEVETERVSPATLVLRAAGQLLAKPEVPRS
jgi:membrane fusion protein (multidrug efflux system)